MSDELLRFLVVLTTLTALALGLFLVKRMRSNRVVKSAQAMIAADMVDGRPDMLSGGDGSDGGDGGGD